MLILQSFYIASLYKFRVNILTNNLNFISIPKMHSVKLYDIILKHICIYVAFIYFFNLHTTQHFYNIIECMECNITAYPYIFHYISAHKL